MIPVSMLLSLAQECVVIFNSIYIKIMLKKDGFIFTTSLTCYRAVPLSHPHVGLSFRLYTYTVLCLHRNTDRTEKINF